MGELNFDELPLPALFEQALKIHTMASNSTVDKEMLKKGVEAMQKCEDMVNKLGLFSANETKEDIATTNIKYILVPFYLAELTEKIEHSNKAQVLKVSQEKLKGFISSCEVMELVPDEELDIRAKERKDTPAARRDKKVARFKRQRAAESKLQEIKERKERRGRSTKAATLSTPVEAGEEDVLDDDEEEEREAWVTTISLALCKAFDLLDMLNKEEEMLSAVKKKQLQYIKPAQPITCATFAQDVVEGRAKVSEAHEHKHQPYLFGPASLVGGRLTSDRERMAAQVFQPGHRLPTMSIEEAGLKEMEIMNNWQEMNAKLFEEANTSWHKERRKPGPPEEDEDDDAAQDKARAWDDWKDDNPRGAGNKKLTPCG
ncbi:hypothetical protein IFM89_026473 [Coptis chinensis]|uniref:PP2A regulatory subunit TAP46 n=1 Tax=Coptis chinensis TaxID=261450 RepID=A0A835M479_9MAGN|nr:hypothetical protein IFM89_026473 [Coptis chinensis]